MSYDFAKIVVTAYDRFKRILASQNWMLTRQEVNYVIRNVIVRISSPVNVWTVEWIDFGRTCDRLRERNVVYKILIRKVV